MHSRFAQGLLLLVAGAVLELPAGATVLYSTFGSPAPGYNPDGYIDVTGASSGGGYQAVAQSFQPSQSMSLSSIDLVLSTSGTSDLFTVNLVSNNSGLPGAVIESYSATATSTTGTYVALDSTLHPTLTVGTTYWIEVLPNNANTNGGWNDTSNTGLAGWAVEFSPGSWEYFSTASPIQAYDVNGGNSGSDPATPEPATALLSVTAGGFFALLMSRRRRRTC